VTKSILIGAFIFFSLIVHATAAEPADKLLAAGRVDEAVSSLQSTIANSAASANSYHLLCRAYLTLGNWDGAITAGEKSVSLDPNNSLYHYWLGRAYGEKADHVSFLTAIGFARKLRYEFETALRLDPSNVAARTDLAEFYLEAPGIVGGGIDKARAQVPQLMPLDPVKAQWVLGRIAEKKKDSVVAENEYRKAIPADNGRGDAWLYLALFYRHNGRFAEMEAALDHIRSAPTSQPKVIMEAAQLLIRTHRNTLMAIDLLQKYLSGSAAEEAPAAHYLLGTLLEQKGDKQAAAQQYRTTLSLARNFALAQGALNRLQNQLPRRG
jgi:tetratricopeptide (TPR) repeat protein